MLHNLFLLEKENEIRDTPIDPQKFEQKINSSVYLNLNSHNESMINSLFKKIKQDEKSKYQ